MEYDDDLDDELLAIRQAALDLLASGPVHIFDLVERLATRGAIPVWDGLTLDDQADLLDELLLCDDDCWVNPDGVYALTTTLLDGAVFTHRLDASELARTAIDITPDLAVVDFGLEAIETVDGIGLEIRYRDIDDERRADEHGSLIGPSGWLASHIAGTVLGVARRGNRVEIVPIVDTADGSDERAAIGTAFRSHHEPGIGVDVHDVVLDALVVNPQLFRSPCRPIAELIGGAGLECRGEWIGRTDEDWLPPGVAREREVREQLGRRFEFDACCDEAFDVVRDAWSEWVIGRRAVAPTATVGAALEHDAVATAFAAWVCERGGGSALLHDFATQLAATAPEHVGIALYVRALNADQDGAVLDAERDLVDALAARPDDPFVLCELARYRADRGDGLEALALYRRAGVSSEDPDVAFLSNLGRGRGVGRNDPCPCGSGRKYKQCCALDPKPRIEDRAAWLFHKLAGFTMHRPHDDEVVSLAVSACDPDRDDFGPERIARLVQDPFILDLCVFEGGHADEFLDSRGALLPADELVMLQDWCETDRRLWQITAMRRESGLTLRDTKTGDVVEVSERAATHTLREGDLLLARVVPVGSQHQLIGQPLRVSLRERDGLLALFDSYPTDDDLAAWYGDRDAPPRLRTREGEEVVVAVAELRAEHDALEVALDTHYERRDDDCWVELIDTHREHTVRASLQLDGDTLTVETISAERLERVVATLRRAVPDIDVIRRDVTPVRRASASPPNQEVVAPAGTDALLAEFMREHEARWLDESVPALGGITPRQAAADPTRREDLVALLREFDRAGAVVREPAATFDTARLRAALGIEP